MSEHPSITRGTRTKGMTIERLHKLRSTWEDGDLDFDDQQEMLEALRFFTADPKCNFCSKTRREVRKLIVGQDVHICDECITQCNDLINEGS